MKIEINKQSGIPLYLQIKEQFKILLRTGELKKGSQLPTERELAAKLDVSRNTVSMAYKDLADEKIISSSPGRGTFILIDQHKSKSSLDKTKTASVSKHIDLAIQQALELNIQFDDFLNFVNQRVLEKKHLLNNVSIAFIECNQEQLYYFSRKLELGTGIHIVPILIDEMVHHKETFLQKARSVDLIVTTFFHYQEVQNFLKNEGKKIIAIALDPQIETMVNIARNTSKDMRIGLICLTDKFAERVLKSIKYAGIHYRNIAFTTDHDQKKIKSFIAGKDLLITSPGRKKEVRGLISQDIPLIEFIYIPDKGSINMLKEKLL